jgi:integrase/recombinase XerD
MASELRTKFENYLIVHRKAPKTQQAYLSAVKGIANYFNRPPDELTSEQIQDYLAHLITERKLSWKSCNVAFCALQCFYVKFLKRSSMEVNIPPRPRQRKLPDIFNKTEVARLIENAKDLRHRAVLMMVYGSGLRVSEVVKLKAEHIDSQRMLVRVEQSKGRKDRYTLLSQKALEVLRLYFRYYHPSTYLFVGKDKNGPLPIATAQKMYTYAKRKAGLTKGSGIHTLRHCFATHLLLHGVDIQLIKEFLGHNHLGTTMVYLHLVPDRIAKVKSPLDEDVELCREEAFHGKATN